MGDRETISTLALDRLAEGVLLVADDGRIAYANLSAANLFGRTVEELVGTPFSVPIQTETQVEISVPSRYQGFRTVQMLVARLEADGKHLSLVSLYDVTALTEAKRALDLESRALREANRNLEAFSQAVSEGLQEPLNGVDETLRHLRDQDGDRLNGEVRDAIVSVQDMIERMSAMVSGLLAYSRVLSEKSEMGPVEGRKVLAAVVADMRSEIAEAGVTLTYESIPPLMGDHEQLAVLFRHLIDNTIRFRSPERAATVHIAVDTRDPVQALVSVADNGIGMSRADFPRVFSVFDTLDCNGARAGVGLGLPLCKRIVDRHGGSIWLESNPGSGTTVHLALPRYMPTISDAK